MLLAATHTSVPGPDPAPELWTVETPDATRTFQILEQLGSGGFGRVYRARDLEHDRIVALKALKLVNGDTLLSFKNEFRSLAGFSHPNLVALHELLSGGGRWFFTMELVDGVDLLTHVTGARALPFALHPTLDMRPPSPGAGCATNARTFDQARLRSTLRQLAEGLHALHRAGKLHRDVKPSNILVTRDGQVKLLDFGLVTAAGGGRTDGRVVGTAEYMAPEQGDGGRESPATDWYSVGVMVYQALTGRLPHEGPWPQILLEKRTPPRPPSTLAWDAAPDLCELCARLLEPDPSRRPRGTEVLAALGGRAPVGARRRAFFDRRRPEPSALRRAFQACRERRTLRVIQVLGPRGAGKTALVERFLSELRREHGGLVLSGRCSARETLPFKALDGVMDALCGHLCQLEADELAAVLPADAWTLPQLFPVFRAVRALEKLRRRQQRVHTDPAALRPLALRALRQLLTRLAVRQPLALFIDDLQLGDPESLSALQALLHPPNPPALLLVLSCRVAAPPARVTVRALDRLAAEEWPSIPAARDRARRPCRQLLPAPSGLAAAPPVSVR